MMPVNTLPSWLDGPVEMTAALVTFDTLAAAAWAQHLQRHARAPAAAVLLRSFRDEVLVADCVGTLSQFFGWSGFEPDALAGGLAAFDEGLDTGAATAHSRRDDKLDEAALSRIRRVFGNPKIKLTGLEGLP